MQEIQERQHVYFSEEGYPYRWHSGELQVATLWGGWVKSDSHEQFIEGDLCVIDPLTSEFVCPPKPERPYNLTTGQMIDALNADREAQFESQDTADGPTVFGRVVVTYAASGLMVVCAAVKGLEFRHLNLDRMWRKVVADDK